MNIPFIEVQQKLLKHFNNMVENNAMLFVTDIDFDTLWHLYLDSFEDGTNEIYVKRREYECSSCRSFIKNIGNVVAIQDGILISIWDFKTGDTNFDNVAKILGEYVTNKPIIDVYFNKEKRVGTEVNYQQEVDSGEVFTWHHYYVDLPHHLISNDINVDKAQFRDNKNVIKRAFEEFTEVAIQSVLELILQKTLYRGEQHKDKIVILLDLFQSYHRLNSNEQDLFCWEVATGQYKYISRIRNESIGTLLIDISSGMDLEQAVRRYENVVAPENYQRPKPIFSKRMLEDARKTLAELGLVDSLPRRFATIEDMSVNDILFMNYDVANVVNDDLDIFSTLANRVATKPLKFDRVSEVSVDTFVQDVLPTTQSIELYFEPKQRNNLVTLTTAVNQDSPSLFSWDNNFGWSYKSGLADSSMKENVSKAGGNVDGVLRFSIQWNTDDRLDKNDYDAHCLEPNGNLIYYPNKQKVHSSTGVLDVDIEMPIGVANENIIWTDINKMPNGIYDMYVHNYSHNGGTNGFSAEIEFNGTIYQFDYPYNVPQGHEIEVAKVKLENGAFSIDSNLDVTIDNKEVWGIKPSNFYNVSMMTYSPNFWQTETGNKHLFFFIPNVICDEPPRGIYNEFLKGEFNKHRKVFEALGSEMQVKLSTSQLSGLGFSRSQDVILKVKGATERVIKVKL